MQPHFHAVLGTSQWVPSTFSQGEPGVHPSIWGLIFASRMLGVNQDEGFKEAVRLYLMLHADHEGATPRDDADFGWLEGSFGMLSD